MAWSKAMRNKAAATRKRKAEERATEKALREHMQANGTKASGDMALLASLIVSVWRHLGQ